MRHNKDGGQRCCRLFGRFSVILLAGVILLQAETFSEFKRQQAAAYKQYKDENDRAFASYLKSQWQAYKKFVSASLYEKPKPKKIPKTAPKPAPKAGPKVIIKVKKPPRIQKPELPPSIIAPTPKPKEKPPITLMPKEEKQKPVTPVTPSVVSHDVVFNFFGTEVGFDVSQKIKKARFYPTNQQGISNYFDSVATSDYKPLIKEIKKVKKAMRLNDWGLYLLVDRIAKEVYRYDDERQLFKWFIFNKLGYAVKVGLADGHVIAMFYSKKIIYSTPNFRFGKKRYYVISHYNKGGIGTVYSYKQNYPNATKAFDLSLHALPLLKPEYKTKRVEFVHLGKKYSITYKYNKNLIDFFATYPQADYATFFNAPVDPMTYVSIADSLRTYINGKRAAEAMNFVLNFVQNAFAYETDQQQFGREKVMFAEETLFYRASDCEDRAILYSFLTKELFGVPVLGIKYPNHMATALYIPLDGDKVRIRGREFVVADPTYINANIGEAMPQFKGKMPEDFIVVSLRE